MKIDQFGEDIVGGVRDRGLFRAINAPVDRRE